MKTFASTLAVLALSLALPGLAAAADTFYVNVLDDLDRGVEACQGSVECSLRNAIERANESGGEPDSVNFELILDGTIELEAALPAILDPLTIDATSAGSYAGAPVIEIDAGGAAYGLRVESESLEGSSTEIRGLSITGAAGPGIHADGSEDVEVCGNYLGVDPSGAAAANEIGVLVGGDALETEIGGPACANLISGNGGAGIVDEGFNTKMADNLIGTDASGEGPLPNAGPGIEVTTVAGSTSVAPFGEGGGPNTIAFNTGPGVLVEDATFATAVYGNSIFENGGLGIAILSGEAPNAPTIESVQYAPETVITGTLVGKPSTTYYLDFYANEACDPSGFGEGQTYLQDWQVTTDPSGIASFTAEEEGEGEGEEGLLPVPPDRKVITATASTQIVDVGESTSEFSRCFPSGEDPPAPPPGPPSPAAQTLVALVPENGETLAVEPVSGTVFIKLPGKGKQVKLTGGMLIPVGSVIDASKGKVTLTSVNKAGETQTAVFFGGRFLVAQRDGSGLVTLKLRGGNLKSCKKAKGSSATASAGRKGRRLWGSGKGRFRTEGNYGSATVRGTVWLTEDRCNGTFFKVRKGVVTVRDFAGNETFPLGRGKSYLARP